MRYQAWTNDAILISTSGITASPVDEPEQQRQHHADQELSRSGHIK
jgi:hypothetical protein